MGRRFDETRKAIATLQQRLDDDQRYFELNPLGPLQRCFRHCATASGESLTEDGGFYTDSVVAVSRKLDVQLLGSTMQHKIRL